MRVAAIIEPNGHDLARLVHTWRELQLGFLKEACTTRRSLEGRAHTWEGRLALAEEGGRCQRVAACRTVEWHHPA